MEESIKSLYGPENLEFVDGNFVEVEGKKHFGWIDNLTKKMYIPRFNEFRKWYKDKISPKAESALEHIQGIMQLGSVKHEYNHKKHPEWSEGVVESEKLKSLKSDSDEEMANLYVHQKRLKGGGEEAEFSSDTLKHYNFRERIAHYMRGSKLRERYEAMGNWVDALLGSGPVPEQREEGMLSRIGKYLKENFIGPDVGMKPAYATVRGD
jgi:hypothetical protein